VPSARAAAMLALLPTLVVGHAVLTSPAPRSASGMQGTGTKLPPFADAALLANGGCGGSANGDPGVQTPTVAFTPGAAVTVSWTLTIPHSADNIDSGIRVAVHYGPGDSFAQNILAGGVVGSGAPGTVSAGLETVQEALPAGKTCQYCTLQWIWSARQDGGSYIGCADIAITANGALPTYTPGAQAGNVLPGVPAALTGPGSIIVPAVNGPPPPPGGVGAPPSNNNGGDKVDTGVGVSGWGVAGFLLLAGGGGFYFYRKRKQGGGPSGTTQVVGGGGTRGLAAAPPPPGPPPSGAAVLPPGWTPQVDPASGRTYYYNTKTGESSWTPPGAGFA